MKLLHNYTVSASPAKNPAYGWAGPAGVLAQRLAAFLLLPALLDAAPVITTDPPPYIRSGHRTLITAEIASDRGINLARTYFKATDTADYHFVAMGCDARRCQTILPKATSSTRAVQYQILFVNEDGQIFKNDISRVPVDDAKDLPSWQLIPSTATLAVWTELPDPPKKIPGFHDNVTYDTVESSGRFGTTVGLYTAVTGSGSTTTVGAAAATTSGGGISTTTLAIAGGTLLVGGGVALALAGGGGDEDEDDDGCDATANDPKITLRWSSNNDLDLIVEDPCGGTIHVQNPQSSCQGYTGLLQQSAGEASAATAPAEIVTYPNGAPSGEFKVYVSDSLNRDGQSTIFTVEVYNQCAVGSAEGRVDPDTMTSVIRFTH